MAIDAKVRGLLEYLDDQSKPHVLGQLATESPVTVTTSADDQHDQIHTVAAGGTAKLFDVDEDLSDFEFMAIIASQAGFIEKIVDDDNDLGELYLVESIKANVPLFIHGNDALAGDGSSAAFDGTADFIETVHYYNSSTSTAAKVRVVAIT